MDINSYIDHTLLKPTASKEEIDQLCHEAGEWRFKAVCVPPFYVKRAKEDLKETPVKVATVIGFPLGYSAIESKLKEVESALEEGVDELDMVINLCALRNKDYTYLEKEVRTLFEPIKEKGKILKVIIESGILSDEEVIQCCNIYGGIGVSFLKTSTGFAEKGASAEAVALMRTHLPSTVKIKAAGGIRSLDAARRLIEAGADRLGCSAGVKIAREAIAGSLQK